MNLRWKSLLCDFHHCLLVKESDNLLRPYYFCSLSSNGCLVERNIWIMVNISCWKAQNSPRGDVSVQKRAPIQGNCEFLNRFICLVKFHSKSYYKSSSVCLFVCLSVCLFVPYLLRGPLTDLRQTWWVYVGGPRNCPWGVLFRKGQRLDGVNGSLSLSTILYMCQPHSTQLQKATLLLLHLIRLKGTFCCIDGWWVYVGGSRNWLLDGSSMACVYLNFNTGNILKILSVLKLRYLLGNCEVLDIIWYDM